MNHFYYTMHSLHGLQDQRMFHTRKYNILIFLFVHDYWYFLISWNLIGCSSGRLFTISWPWSESVIFWRMARSEKLSFEDKNYRKIWNFTQWIVNNPIWLHVESVPIWNVFLFEQNARMANISLTLTSKKSAIFVFCVQILFIYTAIFRKIFVEICKYFHIQFFLRREKFKSVLNDSFNMISQLI